MERAVSDRPKISSWRQFSAILRKDIVAELRTFEMITSMGLYILLTLVVYYLAISQASGEFDVREISAGLLWLAFIFTSLLGLNRSLVHEKDQGVLEAILLSPIDRPVLFAAKAVGNFIFIGIVELLSLPLFYLFILQGKPIEGPWYLLIPPLLLGTIGIAGVGTLLATMSVNTKGRDVILAVMFVPIMFPLLYAAVAATSAVIAPGPEGMGPYLPAMAIAAVYDGIMLLGAYSLYEFIVCA
ncbi:MAG: heme exporter protein CcmB [Coriobacteriales bacterium]|nr:heme exporter protein CcmB [Coriobacteriales bacterium]